MRAFRSLRTLILALVIAAASASSAFAGVFISVGFAPPAFPVYEQPLCPGDGYMWTPGYWSYGPEGYFWVPGAWVLAPYTGALWTPGYWGYVGSAYTWYPGYWGPRVGYYGGINYGYGYGGFGYVGGSWRGGQFFYNSAITRVGPGFRNSYVDRSVINNRYINNNRASFAGPGGVNRPINAVERQAAGDRHTGAFGAQTRAEQSARGDRGAYAKNNGGRPSNAVSNRPINIDRNERPGSVNRPNEGGNNGGVNRPNNAVNRPGNENQQRPGGNTERPTNNVQRPSNTVERPTQQERPQQQQRPTQQERPQQQQRPTQQARPQQQHQQARPQQREKR